MIYFWTEASADIGLGHLVESLALAEALHARGQKPEFLIPPFAAGERMLSDRNVPYSVAAPETIQQTLEAKAAAEPNPVAIVNHRSVELEDLKSLRSLGFRTVVLDQLGGKPVVADILVNASMVDDWLQYDFPEGEPRCLFGPQYALLRKEITAAVNTKRSTNDAKHVLVTMGGVDRSGATLGVVEALRALAPDIRKTVILGPGFRHHDALISLAEKTDASFSFITGADDMGERIASADLVISAGGGTLYECACIGTPVIVLWEDPHEERQGLAFEEMGCAEVLGDGIGVALDRIRDRILVVLDDTDRRLAMATAGQELVDGKGADRICAEMIGLAGA